MKLGDWGRDWFSLHTLFYPSRFTLSSKYHVFFVFFFFWYYQVLTLSVILSISKRNKLKLIY